jgi:hypothetical protein
VLHLDEVIRAAPETHRPRYEALDVWLASLGAK